MIPVFAIAMCPRKLGRLAWGVFAGLLTQTALGQPSKIPPVPVPKSTYLAVAYRYANALLEHGRDVYGPEKSGLFLSALDRAALKPLERRPAAPSGVREGDRVGALDGPLIGANPHHDENLLRLLYVLSGLSSEAKYKEAADGSMAWFLNHAMSEETSLLPWGEHLCWDVMRDRPLAPEGEPVHEFFRPWMLWERCFELAPEPSRRFALGLWRHQIQDPDTGAFDRHALFQRHQPSDGYDFPRHAGFFIRTWAETYDHTRDAESLKAIEVMVARFQDKRESPGRLIPSSHRVSTVWPPSNLSLAIDMDGAARKVPEPLRSRMRAFAEEEDGLFCGLPHAIRSRGGFAGVIDAPGSEPAYTDLWETRYGMWTTAQVAMMCVSRYDNTGRTGFRELIRQSADAYLKSLPNESGDVWPVALGHAISLEVAAWRHFADPVYLERARFLADWAVAHFWEDLALPKASLRSDHYESITGADTLALALIELHMQILAITAVRYPPNTLDR